MGGEILRLPGGEVIHNRVTGGPPRSWITTPSAEARDEDFGRLATIGERDARSLDPAKSIDFGPKSAAITPTWTNLGRHRPSLA